MNKNKNNLNLFILLCTFLIFAQSLYIGYLKENPLVKEIPIEKEVIKEIEIEKEVISEVYIEVEPKQVYEVTSEEREMIARILYREGNGCSLECQKAIVSVIFNRYDDCNKEISIKDLIYAKNQFTPVGTLNRTTPTEKNYEAVDYVIKNGSTLPKNVKYFRANYHFDWEGYIGYTVIDNVYFGYVSK